MDNDKYCRLCGSELATHTTSRFDPQTSERLTVNTAQTFDAKTDAISTATSSVLYGNYNMKTASAADMSFGTTTSNMTPNPITASRERMVQEMVQRFLGWKLPSDFNPDGGITFEPEFNKEYMAKQGKPPMHHEPTGTNLLTAVQAKEMVEYVLRTTQPTI